MALLAQRHGDWGCLIVLHLKHKTYFWGSVPSACGRRAPNMRTSAISSQPEGASLEIGFLASYAHGTAGTEAKRVGLLAGLSPQT